MEKLAEKIGNPLPPEIQRATTKKSVNTKRATDDKMHFASSRVDLVEELKGVEGKDVLRDIRFALDHSK